MAMLQAARAERLGLPERSAQSWGLNRAIFYAAAKRGFRGGATGVPGEGSGAAGRPEGNTYSLGDDFAYRDLSAPDLRFTIGGETQTPEKFHQQVAARFGSEQNFRRAWTEARELVDGFDEPTLRSRARFYSVVYKPRRDPLVEQWTRQYGPPAPADAAAGAPKPAHR